MYLSNVTTDTHTCTLHKTSYTSTQHDHCEGTEPCVDKQIHSGSNTVLSHCVHMIIASFPKAGIMKSISTHDNNNNNNNNNSTIVNSSPNVALQKDVV